MSYKSFLSDINKSKPSPTQEQIDRCLANEEANRIAAAAQAAAKIASTPASTLATRQAKLQAKIQSRANKLNMSYVQWEQRARTYYTIDPITFTVISTARSPNTPPETWGPFTDMVEAEEKVLELMDYKYNDHFNKGHDFKW